MMESNSTIVQMNNDEKIYYEKVDEYINSLDKKFREKCVIKQQGYDDILKCLLLPKGSPPDAYSSTFVYWVKHKFILIKIAGIDIVACIKSKKPICVYEAFYNVINEAHAAVSHGGREKTYFELNSQYSWIPRFCVEIFLKQCLPFATKLRDLFFTFGPPRILHSDNGREFISNVITELKNLFPDLVFIRGRPRHPQSQGCIERANGILCEALGKWMCTNNSTSWSFALAPVIYGLNTRMSSVTKTTPYEVMFGQQPRSDSDFWKLIQQNGVEDEENLPTPVAELNDELNDDLNDDQGDSLIHFDKGIDADVVDLDKLSNDAVSCSLSNTPSTPRSSSITEKTPKKHDLVRKIATDNYLTTANKKMKLYRDSLNLIANNFNINDCVGIAIHTVDRTNTDPKYLPCLIIEKNEKNNISLYKLICQYGILQNTFEAGQFMNLKDACPNELKQIDVSTLKPITIIEASKLYSRGSTTGRTCNCQGKCATKSCP
ncbi:unnamed protein product, partial [Rotaria sp. Silwood1]